MDLKKIGYFFRAAELENFTKAAADCHIAQTTMSKYVNVLEEELGCRLFVRQHQKAQLTPEGRKFYEGMKKIDEEYQELCKSLHKDESRELHIGMITTDYTDFPILREFEQEYPQYALYFSFASEQRLAREFLERKLDALICPSVLNFNAAFQGQEGLRRVEIFRNEGVLICSREMLSRYGSLGGVIAHLPMITKTEEEEYPSFCREKLRELYGTGFQEVIAVKSFPAQLLMVNLSGGFAIVPEKAVFDKGNLAVFPLPECFQEISQLICREEDHSPVLSALIDYLHEKKC